jgi:glycine cleavage system aminomethyltransferase T
MAVRNYAESHPVMRVSTKRFASSPFLDRYITDDAVFGVYNGRLYALSLGDDPTEGYWRLRRHAALFDVPERPIQVEGPDAERLLNMAFTRDVGTLAPGRAGYAIACRDDGGIIMDGVLIRFSPDRFWYVLADGEFFGWLGALARGMDATVSDPSAWVLQIQGPASMDVLDAACDDGRPEPFRYFAVAEVRIAGQPVVITRTGWSGESGFEVYTSPEVDAGALWDRLLEAGAPHGLAVQSLASMGIRRIEAGILDNGTDMDPQMTPFAAGLGRFVDLEKPEFVGRQALEAVDRRPVLFGVSSPTSTPVPGGHVLHEGEIVGQVTAGAWSPFLERGIGYARMREPREWAGTHVLLDGAAAELVSIPFYDPERTIPRGS